MTEPVRRDWCEEHDRADLSATNGLCPDCEERSVGRAVDPLDGLSWRARKLLERVSNPHNWYQAYVGTAPAAMQELVDAGLVRRGSRMPVVNTYFVPTGYEMEYRERYPDACGRSYDDGPKETKT